MKKLLVFLMLFLMIPTSVGASSCRMYFSGGSLCVPVGNWQTHRTVGYALDVDSYPDGGKLNISVKKVLATGTQYDALQAFDRTHMSRTDRIYNDSSIMTVIKNVNGSDEVVPTIFYNSTLPDGSDFHGGMAATINTCGYTYTIEVFSFGSMSEDIVGQTLDIYDSVEFYGC